MKTLIIDADLGIHRQLNYLLSEAFPNAQIIGTATSCRRARQMLHATPVQVAFVAGELPDGSGFDLLPAYVKGIFMLPPGHPTLKALQFSQTAHLVKPLQATDFYKFIIRWQQRNYEAAPPPFPALDLRHHRIAIPKTNGYEFIPVAPIVFCAAEKDHCSLHLECGRVVYTTKSIKEMAKLLTDYGFSRVHRSHLVNLHQIKRYFKGDGGKIRMSNDAVIEVSRRCKKTFLRDLRVFHML
ncbi:MAG: LytTR family DNA-binding domain-containing protein [Bacteroidota bacterium]